MRLYRISFVAGLAIGFVAGTRAGREKYEQMVKLARQTADNPSVQQAAGAIQAQASDLFSTATKKVQDRAPHLAHMIEDRIPGMRHRNGHDGSAAGDRKDEAGRYASAGESGQGQSQPGTA